ncbi:MAG: hypothetical protein C6I00_03400 [Nitratiruptor sp.]|nr:hypothetical protein [Nitratiruptor sp.]NPA83145.1 hypothetical protein [Campylobacterota bacterium]
MRALIVSDGRRGHLNQALAFCHYAGLEYEIVEVRFRSRLAKGLGYGLDWLGLYTRRLFEPFALRGPFDLVVGAGSSTYYALKLLAREYGAKSVALMNPKGFRKDFDLIFTQPHDKGEGIEIPVNFAYAKATGLVELGPRDVAFVVGGPNKRFAMEPEEIEQVAEFLFANFDGKRVLSTSPRTPRAIEELLEGYPWDYKVIYSKNPINPIGDFLQAGYVFITQDSTSMISEALSGGRAAVEVVKLKGDGGKFQRFVEYLAQEGYLHLFDGALGNARRKVDFGFVRALVADLEQRP